MEARGKVGGHHRSFDIGGVGNVPRVEDVGVVEVERIAEVEKEAEAGVRQPEELLQPGCTESNRLRTQEPNAKENRPP